MAITQGGLIYASDINSVNGNPSYSGTLSSGADWIQDSIGNNGIVYSHRASGQLLFYAPFKCGIFGGGKFRIKKWVNGGWNETVYSRDFGWNTNTTVSVNSTGPGAYRIYSDTAFAFNAIPWKVYCGQNTCTKGKPIVCWDDFKSSLNKVNTGVKITVSYANAQKLGNE